MHLALRQVPVPQAQLAGFQRQAQARFALPQFVSHPGEFGGALGDPLLQAVVGTP